MEENEVSVCGMKSTISPTLRLDVVSKAVDCVFQALKLSFNAHVICGITAKHAHYMVTRLKYTCDITSNLEVGQRVG